MLYTERVRRSCRILKKCYIFFLSLHGEDVFSPVVVLYFERGRFMITVLALAH